MSIPSRRLFAASLGAAALVAGPFAVAPASAEPVSIQIVGINDFHGRLEPVDETDAGEPVGGAQQLAGALEQLRDANPNTVFVSAGDNIGASTFTSLIQDDEPTIEALDAMGLAASALGNHEFDRGFDDISGRVAELADFPYLGANVYDADTGDVLFQEYEIVPVGGIDVGFVGVLTADTPELVAPDGIVGLEFGDVTEAANRVATQLSDGDDANGEADLVVLLSHTGAETTECADVATGGEFGALLNGLTDATDVVFSGHTHLPYACEVTGDAGFDGPVVQSGSYGENFDLVELTVEATTGEVTGATAAFEPVVGFPMDANPAVSGIVDEAVAFAEEIGATPLGSTTTDIRRAGQIVNGEFEDDRGVESVLGNFIADVQLAQTRESGAQIAFMNPGGLRDDFLVDPAAGDDCGAITLAEANTVQPFANGLVTMTLTGAQIKEVLEQQWQPEEPDVSRPVLALGVSEGFFFTFDETRPRLDRITSMTLNGTPIEPDQTYRVTVNSFLAAGGDNFDTLAEGTERTELGQTDLEALADYLATNSPVTPDLQSRRTPEGEQAGVLPAGDACQDGAPTPPADGGTPPKGQNPGLSVDTGVESTLSGQVPAAAALAAVVALGVFVGLLRRRDEVER